MTADDAIANGEAQSSALSNRLGREERIEDFVEIARRNADASILKLDANCALAILQLGSCADRECSSHPWR